MIDFGPAAAALGGAETLPPERPPPRPEPPPPQPTSPTPGLGRATIDLLDAGTRAVTKPVMDAAQDLLRSLVKTVALAAAVGALAATGTVILGIGVLGALVELLGRNWIVNLMAGGLLLTASISIALLWRHGRARVERKPPVRAPPPPAS